MFLAIAPTDLPNTFTDIPAKHASRQTCHRRLQEHDQGGYRLHRRLHDPRRSQARQVRRADSLDVFVVALLGVRVVDTTADFCRVVQPSVRRYRECRIQRYGALFAAVVRRWHSILAYS